jgi:hypothetical protein
MKVKTFLAGVFAALAIPLACAAQAEPPPPSPAALEAARHLLKTMRADQAFERMMSRIQEPVLAKLREDLPSDDVKVAEALAKAVVTEQAALEPKLFEADVTIYASVFTEQELREIDRFYTSPAGQALIDKQAQVSARFLPIYMAESPALVDRIIDRFCAQAGCSDDLRAAMLESRGHRKRKKAE